MSEGPLCTLSRSSSSSPVCHSNIVLIYSSSSSPRFVDQHCSRKLHVQCETRLLRVQTGHNRQLLPPLLQPSWPASAAPPHCVLKASTMSANFHLLSMLSPSALVVSLVANTASKRPLRTSSGTLHLLVGHCGLSPGPQHRQPVPLVDCSWWHHFAGLDRHVRTLDGPYHHHHHLIFLQLSPSPSCGILLYFKSFWSSVNSFKESTQISKNAMEALNRTTISR